MDRTRRKRRRGRLVFWAVAMAMVIGIIGPVGLAHTASGMFCCGGGGGGGGSCPTPYVIDLTASVAVNPTNATVTYAASSTSPLPWGFGNLYWGKSTSYGYTAATGQSFGTLPTGGATDFLNYLAPSTTYYFEVTASDTCTDGGGTHTYSGSYTGSWTTGVDSMQTITGTIYDTNGNVDPGNLYVTMACQGSSPSQYDLTSSSGQYGFAAYLGSYLGWACSGSYVISVDNWPIDWAQELNVWSSYWPGHWNETIVVAAPQVVNFYLPTNYVSGWVPLTYDFATNSAYSQFTVSSSSTFTTQESYALSVSGAVNGVSVGGGTTYQTSETQSFSQTFTSVVGSGLVIQQEYLVTGTMVFNGPVRVVSLFPDFFTPSGSIGSGTPTVSDWLSQPACNSAPAYVKCVYQENTGTVSFSVGGSVQLSSSFNIGVSVPIDLPGLGITGSVSDSYTVTFSSSNSASYTLTITVSSPSGTCYGWEYEIQGDSSLSKGVVGHVWGLGVEPSSDCG